MNKLIFCLLVLIHFSSLFAGCSQVPVEIRKEYANHFYQAFLLQSRGQSTNAFCQFQSAYETAKQAGENNQRLSIIKQLFEWYRMYGSSLRLFYTNPSGQDRIIGEYRKPFYKSPGYYSEFGNSPEQSAIIREFMLGVAETISGVFCVVAGSGVVSPAGIGLTIDGSRRILLTLNNLWTEHQKALVDLRKWEENTQKAISSD